MKPVMIGSMIAQMNPEMIGSMPDEAIGWKIGLMTGSMTDWMIGSMTRRHTLCLSTLHRQLSNPSTVDGDVPFELSMTSLAIM
jgi:hypothetical protein